MEKAIIIILMAVLLCVSVTALTCSTSLDDITPLESVDLYCYDVSSDYCYLTIYTGYENTSLIGAFPETSFSSDSYFNGFPVRNNLSVLTFSTMNMKSDRAYNLTAHCGLSNYTQVYNAEYAQLNTMGGIMWGIRNAWAMVGLAMLSSIFIILMYLFIRTKRRDY